MCLIVEKTARRWYITEAVIGSNSAKKSKEGGDVGHDIRGADRRHAGIGWGITVKTVDMHEKAQIDKVLEISNTINFLGRTLPADADITDSVIELKAQFDQINRDAIKDPVGCANYDAVKTFFDTHLG